MAKQLKYCLRFNWNNYKRNSDTGVHNLQWYEFETVSDLLQWFILYSGTHTRVKQRQDFVCNFPFEQIFGEWWIVTSLARRYQHFRLCWQFFSTFRNPTIIEKSFLHKLTFDLRYALFSLSFSLSRPIVYWLHARSSHIWAVLSS